MQHKYHQIISIISVLLLAYNLTVEAAKPQCTSRKQNNVNNAQSIRYAYQLKNKDTFVAKPVVSKSPKPGAKPPIPMPCNLESSEDSSENSINSRASKRYYKSINYPLFQPITVKRQLTKPKTDSYKIQNNLLSTPFISTFDVDRYFKNKSQHQVPYSEFIISNTNSREYETKANIKEKSNFRQSVKSETLKRSRTKLTKERISVPVPIRKSLSFTLPFSAFTFGAVSTVVITIALFIRINKNQSVFNIRKAQSRIK